MSPIAGRTLIDQWINTVSKPIREYKGNGENCKILLCLHCTHADGESLMTARPEGNVNTPVPTIAFIKLKVAADTLWPSESFWLGVADNKVGVLGQRTAGDLIPTFDTLKANWTGFSRSACRAEHVLISNDMIRKAQAFMLLVRLNGTTKPQPICTFQCEMVPKRIVSTGCARGTISISF